MTEEVRWVEGAGSGGWHRWVQSFWVPLLLLLVGRVDVPVQLVQMGCESGGGGDDGHADNWSDLLPLVVATSGDEESCQGGEGPADDAGHLVCVHGHDLVRGRLGLGQLCEGGWDDHLVEINYVFFTFHTHLHCSCSILFCQVFLRSPVVFLQDYTKQVGSPRILGDWNTLLMEKA